MQFFLSILHGLDYFIVHILIGTLFFCSFIENRFRPRLTLLTCSAFGLSSLWMIFSAHEMADSWTFTDLWTAMAETSFGHIWCFRILVLLFLAIASKSLIKKPIGLILLCILATTLILFSSFTSHAANRETGLVLAIIADSLHSFAIAIWTGGICALYFWLGDRLACVNATALNSNENFKTVERFSHFAMVATGIIATTGVYLTYIANVSFSRPWSTQYGLFITGKVLFFLLALAAASVNHFKHLRKWQPGQDELFMKSLRREIRLEGIAIIVIFALAGFLTRTALPE
jgi:putative copper export protein